VPNVLTPMEYIKILYTTDWHLCSKCPGKRAEHNFFDLQVAKVDEIIKFAIEEKVTAIIHGGDFFDSPRIDYWLLNMMIAKFNELQEHGIDVYLVPGSHDMYGYNINSIHSTAIGALEATGLISILNGPTKICDINIMAIPATLQHGLDLYTNLGADVNMVISHNTLTPEPVPYSHILLKDLPGTDRIYLLGHYHKFIMCNLNGNTFLNPGPLIRTDISEQAHTPGVILLTYDESSHIKLVQRRRLVSAKADVFVKETEVPATLDFVDSIRSTTFKYCDLFDLTKQIAKSINAPKDVLDGALMRLEKVQKEIA